MRFQAQESVQFLVILLHPAKLPICTRALNTCLSVGIVCYHLIEDRYALFNAIAFDLNAARLYIATQSASSPMIRNTFALIVIGSRISLAVGREGDQLGARRSGASGAISWPILPTKPHEVRRSERSSRCVRAPGLPGSEETKSILRWTATWCQCSMCRPIHWRSKKSPECRRHVKEDAPFARCLDEGQAGSSPKRIGQTQGVPGDCPSEVVDHNRSPMTS